MGCSPTPSLHPQLHLLLQLAPRSRLEHICPVLAEVDDVLEGVGRAGLLVTQWREA